MPRHVELKKVHRSLDSIINCPTAVESTDHLM